MPLAGVTGRRKQCQAGSVQIEHAADLQRTSSGKTERTGIGTHIAAYGAAIGIECTAIQIDVAAETSGKIKRTAVDPGGATEGVVAGQRQTATADFDQIAIAADVIAERPRRGVGNSCRERGTQCGRPEHGLLGIDVTHTINIVNTEFAQIGGGGNERITHLAPGHAWKGFINQCGDAADDGRSGGSAGEAGRAVKAVIGVRRNRISGIDRRQQQIHGSRSGNAELLGHGAASVRVTGDGAVQRAHGNDREDIVQIRIECRRAGQNLDAVFFFIAGGNGDECAGVLDGSELGNPWGDVG